MHDGSKISSPREESRVIAPRPVGLSSDEYMISYKGPDQIDSTDAPGFNRQRTPNSSKGAALHVES